MLYEFKGGHDGAFPSTGLVELDGKLYGTTGPAGAYGVGTIFEIVPLKTRLAGALDRFARSSDDQFAQFQRLDDRHLAAHADHREVAASGARKCDPHDAVARVRPVDLRRPVQRHRFDRVERRAQRDEVFRAALFELRARVAP